MWQSRNSNLPFFFDAGSSKSVKKIYPTRDLSLRTVNELLINDAGVEILALNLKPAARRRFAAFLARSLPGMGPPCTSHSPQILQKSVMCCTSHDTPKSAISLKFRRAAVGPPTAARGGRAPSRH
jgi:hypothetical protein